jgi:polysaccharide export outer membrane protein
MDKLNAMQGVSDKRLAAAGLRPADRTAKNSHGLLRVSMMTLALFGGITLAGCVGQHVSYPAASNGPEPKINLIPITAQYLAEHAEQQAVVDETVVPQDLTAVKYRYIIRPGDILDISIPDIVTLNSASAPSILPGPGRGYVVSPEGNIFLPYSGTLAVDGLTPSQAQTVVTKALGQYLKQPQVVVSVLEYRSQRVLLSGQVPKPGYLPISDVPLTLIGALSEAGGVAAQRGLRDPRPIGGTTQNQPLEFPDFSRVLLRRNGQKQIIDVEKIIDQGDTQNDIVLQDGDVVVVPRVQRANIFVLGEILKPTLFEITPKQTNLAEVLMAAGGINQLTSDPARLYIVRGNPAAPTVYQIDAHAPDGMLLAQQFEVQPRDVIYVAEATATRWNRFLQQILPSLQGILATAVTTNAVDNLGN